ncbi:thiamine pyrophosphate-binding protein [Pigmentiphaga soli]|uniref:Thiamine pyrophosphate-binding protein n=1 Tax=Pigmentiphaga soli TaxID=1007095 RepID=A0ABP8HBI8_9BURK
MTSPHLPRAAARVDRPVSVSGAAPQWGSDYFAELIRATGIEYLALNPGASFRGLHDSLVNHLGNRDPSMLLCLHEEHAVAIAQGYAKASGRPMGVFLHSNVGLMHASMAVFNAWCDRVPMLLFGATGPVDAAERRPWIDWLHTAKDQGSLVRDFIKWDDQPASLAAAAESVMRARALAQAAPCGPTYVCFDVGLQEKRVEAMPPLPDPARYAQPADPVPPAAAIEAAADALAAAERPLILVGRVSRSEAAWNDRIALAELLGARVLTDLKTAAGFPPEHPLHVGPPGAFLSPPQVEALRDADVVLAFDWIALEGALRTAVPQSAHPARVINVSLDSYIHGSWSMDHQGLAPVDIGLAGQPDDVLPMLLAALRRRIARPRSAARLPAAEPTPLPAGPKLDNATFAATVRHALEGRHVTVTRLNLGWPGDGLRPRHPLDYLGNDGGAGVGSGPGNAIGSALALQGSGRAAVAVIGDGDFLMGNSALWTAAHYRIPLLIVIANNQSFYNDELHQERMAVQRGRPVENKWIGQAIREPAVDLLAIAAAQGARAIGPVSEPAALAAAIADGLEQVRAGALCVIDARVEPEYDPSMKRGMAVNTEPGR